MTAKLEKGGGTFQGTKMLLCENALPPLEEAVAAAQTELPLSNYYTEPFSEPLRRLLAVHQRGWIGDPPLHWPCHNGHAEIVTMLLDAGADVEADEINCYGGKPLHWASEHEPDIVRLLLERGAKVNSVNVRQVALLTC